MKTKEKKFKVKNKYTREQLKEILKTGKPIESFVDLISGNLKEKEVKIIMDITREIRIDELIQKLNINFENYLNNKNKIIKLKPNSKEYSLISNQFKKHDGLYKLEDLLNEYHDSVLREGTIIGISYGKKFIIEDIQNGRYTKEDFINMNPIEIKEYCFEDIDEK